MIIYVCSKKKSNKSKTSKSISLLQVKAFPLVEPQGLIAFVLVSVLKPYRFSLFSLIYICFIQIYATLSFYFLQL